MVLDQVPQLGARLLVGRDHGRPRAQAVRAAGRPQEALWETGEVWRRRTG